MNADIDVLLQEPNNRTTKPFPSDWQPAWRVLLFDDEYTHQDVLNESRSAFGSSPDFHSEWSPGGSVKLDRYGWIASGIELILCRVFQNSLKLIGGHFDVLLLDIDFGHDPNPVPGFTEQTHLGGILLGLCFLTRPETVSFVYTGQGGEMRRNNVDYWYLDEAKENFPNALEPLSIHDLSVKNLRIIVEMSFERWCVEVLPQLSPDISQLSVLVKDLTAGSSTSELHLGKNARRNGVCLNTIPGPLFGLLPDDKTEVLSVWSRAICGHQLVRRAFCKVVHFGELGTNQTSAVLNQESQCGVSQKNIEEFHDNLRKIGNLFGITYDDLLSELSKDTDKKFKTITRMNIAKAVTETGNAASVVFGIFREPSAWKRSFNSVLHSLLCSGGGTCTLSVTAQDFAENKNVVNTNGENPGTSWARRIQIIGDRTDNEYFVETGGSWSRLIEDPCQLGKIASRTRLIGPAGAVDLKTRGTDENSKEDKLTLEIIVNHTPATE